jgi:hypothetical protein
MLGGFLQAAEAIGPHFGWEKFDNSYGTNIV